MKKVIWGFILLISMGNLSCKKEEEIVYVSYNIDYTVTDTIKVEDTNTSGGEDTLVVILPKPNETLKDANFEYLILEDMTVKITKILNEAIIEGNLRIPDTTSTGVTVIKGETFYVTGGLPIRVIGEGALAHIANKTIIKNVKMDFITEVGKELFSEYSKLKTVSMKAVETVGEYAFNKCYDLTSVEMPIVKTVRSHAFFNCTNLTSLDMPLVETIENRAFYTCNKTTSVNMPVVKTIEDRAFGDCAELTTVTMPETECCFKDQYATDSNNKEIDSFGGETQWKPENNETVSNCS